MAKRAIFLILLSTFITTSWCRNGRFTPEREVTGSSWKAMNEAIPEKLKGKWKWPTLKDYDDLYQLENVFTSSAYADKTKKETVKDPVDPNKKMKKPFGCFLEPDESKGDGTPEDKLLQTVSDGNKKVLGIAKLPSKTEKDFEFIVSKRKVPFLVNYREQKYKLIYVEEGQDITDITGLKEIKIYPLRHTLFGEGSHSNARFSPFGKPSRAEDPPKKKIVTFKSVKEKFDEGEKAAGKAWKWPELQTVAYLYQLENVLTATAYADGFKNLEIPDPKNPKKTIKANYPYGCFLQRGIPLPDGVAAVLGKGVKGKEIVKLKGYGEPLTFSQERFNYNSRNVPFFINYGDQKWKIMYVTTRTDLRSLPGLKELRVYYFRNTVIPSPRYEKPKAKASAPKKAAAYLQDAGDLYYDDWYYQNDYYDENGYYEEYYDDDGQYGYDDDLYYHYNAGNEYGRNGLYRLMRAYRNGLYQN